MDGQGSRQRLAHKMDKVHGLRTGGITRRKVVTGLQLRRTKCHTSFSRPARIGIPLRRTESHAAAYSALKSLYPARSHHTPSYGSSEHVAACPFRPSSALSTTPLCCPAWPSTDDLSADVSLPGAHLFSENSNMTLNTLSSEMSMLTTQ